jgi:hypothetical protein
LIGNKGCEFLSQADWPCLKRLCLRKDSIESDGVAYLTKANWPLLEIISLSTFIQILGHNIIGKKGCLELCRAKWPYLRSI